MEVHHHPMGERKGFREYFLEFLRIQDHIREATALQESLPNATITSDATEIYVDFRHLIRQLGIRVYVSDRTIVQLRNSGGMRLIRNRGITDGLLHYYNY